MSLELNGYPAATTHIWYWLLAIAGEPKRTRASSLAFSNAASGARQVIWITPGCLSILIPPVIVAQFITWLETGNNRDTGIAAKSANAHLVIVTDVESPLVKRHKIRMRSSG